MHCFITGTDTHVGKTYVTGLLLEALRREGVQAVGYKPVAAGDRTDAAAILHACNEPGLTIEEVNPLFFKAPAAPYVASLLENRPMDVAVMKEGFAHLVRKFSSVLVEGAGGWEVPLTATSTMADFAQDLALPVIVVVNNKLGALNHTILTVKNIRARGMTCAGVILNGVADERDSASISNRAMIEQFLEVPVIAEIMHGETEMLLPHGWPE
ncbi:MAG: biod: dethiobiotin synthase [Verrucomicrobiaceae bacterium]|nr:biod: dethiobiotin synthase [Verrucomicrobiaceae bacterium]